MSDFSFSPSRLLLNSINVHFAGSFAARGSHPFTQITCFDFNVVSSGIYQERPLTLTLFGGVLLLFYYYYYFMVTCHQRPQRVVETPHGGAVEPLLLSWETSMGRLDLHVPMGALGRLGQRVEPPKQPQ